MQAPTRLVARAVLALAALLLPACGGDGPSSRDLRDALSLQLPAYLEAASLDVATPRAAGADAASAWSAAFIAELKLKEDTYQEVQRDGDVLLVRRVAGKGDERKVNGKALATLAGSAWRSEVSLDSDPTPDLGQPLGAFKAARVIVVGSPEHVAYAEERRNAILSGGGFEGTATGSAGASYPVSIRLTAYDPKTGLVKGEVTWSSLGGASKTFQGMLTGRALAAKETGWVARGDGSALFPLEYHLDLDAGLRSMAGTWQGAGYSGRVKMERK